MREERPSDDSYYETRLPLLSQGDIFRDVPLAYPVPGESEMPESMALLYMPVTMHHDIIDGQRTTQLAVEGARQLHFKLVWFASAWQEPRSTFEPPLD